MSANNKIENFITKSKKIYETKKTTIFTLISLIIILIIGFSIFTQQRAKKEREISIKVNTFAFDYRSYIAREGESAIIDDKITKISSDLASIYQNNPSLVNSIRGLFLAAEIDLRQGKTKEAKEKYLTIFNKHKKHFLAANALLFAAIASEEEDNIKEAINLLQKFKIYYPTHYLYGQALLTLAREYKLNNNFQKSKKTLMDLIENKDFSGYTKKAQKQLQILELKTGSNTPNKNKTFKTSSLLK